MAKATRRRAAWRRALRQAQACSEGAPLQTHDGLALRMGFRYAKGLREETAQAIVRERSKRPFESIVDLAHRVPELRRKELVLLASIGALNSIGCVDEKDSLASISTDSRLLDLGGAALQRCSGEPGSPALAAEVIANHLPQALKRETLMEPDCRSEDLLHPSSVRQHPSSRQRLHRRDALWQVERAVRFAGPLLEGIPESDTASPLAPMTPEERLVADFRGAGLTVGPHPMAYRRADLQRARRTFRKGTGRKFRTALMSAPPDA